MQWTHDYQLFLLDFDGLLVDTETLHYQAYVRMCETRGFHLPWSFEDFGKAAHFDSKQLRIALYKTLPGLLEQEPNWSVLYTEKKQHYLTILQETNIELMPGVESFLLYLKEHRFKRCVVTHSPQEQVAFIRHKNKALQTIENWITREDYRLSKPNPEPYLKAIERFASGNDRIIGFEDSPRGVFSLLGTPAKAVMINQQPHEEVLPLIQEKKIAHFPSFRDIPAIF